MAEEATQAVEENQPAVAETTATDSQPVEQTKPAEGEQGKPAGEPAKPAESPAAPTGEQKQEQKPQSHQSRRSSRFMPQRIQQLASENAKLKQQQTQKPAEGAVDEWGNPTEAKPNEQPDLSALVAQEVERRLNPVMSEHSKSADDGEINELFSGDKAAERTKYEESIRKMWELDQYKNVAASDLYKMLAYDSMQETVNQAVAKAIAEYKQAEKDAKDASASGSSNTSNRTGDHSPAMTDAELLANNERIKAGVK